MNRKMMGVLAMFSLVLAACGGSDDAGGEPDDVTAPTDSDSATTTTSPTDDTTTSTGASAGNGTAIVTFEEDGSTIEFTLDEASPQKRLPDSSPMASGRKERFLLTVSGTTGGSYN